MPKLWREKARRVQFVTPEQKRFTIVGDTSKMRWKACGSPTQ